MLIPFPFAFCVGAVAFDAIGLLGGLPAFWKNPTKTKHRKA
jgi:uncharacterized membrane protein